MSDATERIGPDDRLEVLDPEVPIACTITEGEGAAQEQRLGMLHAAGVLGVERDGLRARIAYRPTPEARDALRAFVATEQRCCPFFDLRVRDTGDDLALEVAAPEEARPLFESLVRYAGGES